MSPQPFDSLKGFAVTFRQIFKKPITQQYPEYKRPVYPRFRGRHRSLAPRERPREVRGLLALRGGGLARPIASGSSPTRTQRTTASRRASAMHAFTRSTSRAASSAAIGRARVPVRRDHARRPSTSSPSTRATTSSTRRTCCSPRRSSACRSLTAPSTTRRSLSGGRSLGALSSNTRLLLARDHAARQQRALGRPGNSIHYRGPCVLALLGAPDRVTGAASLESGHWMEEFIVWSSGCWRRSRCSARGSRSSSSRTPLQRARADQEPRLARGAYLLAAEFVPPRRCSSTRARSS